MATQDLGKRSVLVTADLIRTRNDGNTRIAGYPPPTKSALEATEAFRALAPEDLLILDGLQLLTAKPVLYVANVAEADAARAMGAAMAPAKANLPNMAWSPGCRRRG